MNIFTIGHSTHTEDKFIQMLHEAVEEHIPGQWGAPSVLNIDGTVIYPNEFISY